MAKKKCYICKQSYDSKQLNIVLKHYICPNCFDKYLQSSEYHKEKLIDDIWQLYDEKPNFAQLKAQIDELHTRYNFSYEGMEWALAFYLKFNKWNQQYLLYQAFPKAYYEAKAYYTKQVKIKNSIPNQITKPKQITSTTSSGSSFKPPLPI